MSIVEIRMILAVIIFACLVGYFKTDKKPWLAGVFGPGLLWSVLQLG